MIEFFKSKVEGISDKGFAIGKFQDAVLDIVTAQDAQRFFDGYQDWVNQCPKPKGTEYRSRTAHEVATANIRWALKTAQIPLEGSVWEGIV